jgi:hypothetical protein
MNDSYTKNNITIICSPFDPGAPQAKLGFDGFMFTAYSFLLLSYININILVFRLVLVLAYIFFIIWSLTPQNAVMVDTIAFSCLFILISILQSIPLIKQIWPVRISRFENDIFLRDFRDYMNIRQFKHFISSFNPVYYGSRNKQVCQLGQNFEYLIYIAKIYPGWRVNLIGLDEIRVTELKEGSWIGTIEFSLFEGVKNLRKKHIKQEEEIKWLISSSVEEVNSLNLEIGNSAIKYGVIQDCGVIAYHIDLKVIYLLKIILLEIGSII